MTGKLLMILGGGKDALPLIEQAKAKGARTMVCDLDDACPASGTADLFCKVDPLNVEAVQSMAAQMRVERIIATHGSRASLVEATVAKALGLR